VCWSGRVLGRLRQPVYEHRMCAARFETAFASLGEDFSDVVTPAAFPQTRLCYRNGRWAARVGLDGLSEAAWIEHFGRFRPFPGYQAPPRAMRYHGHQFRHYNPDLGDGRGFLFAQLRDLADQRLLDLATKGSGQTPYSRAGDGRLTLKGGVREVLATAMLEARGVYTSKSLSLIETGEALMRNDEPSPTRAGILVRLSHSHIRFGTFQRHAFHNRPDSLQALVDHCGVFYFPDLMAADGAARAASLLEIACRCAANLVASWMAAGFVHGVLNTDNMNITGESFDYGPYRFLPRADPTFTAAYFDESGLYAFARQPEAVFWNLKQLAGALSLVCDKESLVAALATYPHAYRAALVDKMFAMLGIAPGDMAADGELIEHVFGWMAATGADWEQFFFDWFCAPVREGLDSPQSALYAGPEWAVIETGLRSRTPVDAHRLRHGYWSRARPSSLLIGEIETLWRDIAEADDWSGFHAKLAEIEAVREAYAFQPQSGATLSCSAGAPC
jgi:uncharacterized protein YdiU (UPF0061 family)